ncbi:MAG TPA: signal recognition particle-docking protein FtsY [Alphaproteobacteria bacterium]|nr:signal recognition particle-docking protein FtsY [Alphaproteobacteria bacterium]
MNDQAPKKTGFFSRLTQGLARSAQSLTTGVTKIFTRKKLDQAALDELEELLIASDMGAPVAEFVVQELKNDRFNSDVTDQEVKEALAAKISEILRRVQRPLRIDPTNRPHVILVAGVNGSGKTTTIGKLAAKFRREGLSVLLAAGDTFRAAAIEQLKIWSERTGAEIVAREQGSDAASLAFEAIERARAINADVVLIDTAGRLQNKAGLMAELDKMIRVIKKIDPTAPHATILVLDATTGQNAISQVEIFRDIAKVTGAVMTKLDGTARGGILVSLAEKFDLPIHYIGVGEAVDDLQTFDAEGFSRAIVGADAKD